MLQTEASVMGCRAVLAFLWLLMSQVACLPPRAPVGNAGALNKSIPVMRGEIRTALDNLESSLYPQRDAPGVAPNISCLLPNITVQQQPLMAQHFSCFRCHMFNLLKLTPELSSNLTTLCQFAQNLERLMGGRRANLVCSLPAFEQDVEKYEYLRGLLKLLDQRLSMA
ncbi:hypothetical protein L3Q82_006925 [Scortum barcoo]|uniref:Uncharacterized protein n=1 Tax=Scortum barcoo TaxID=214431 RepID=A0ACB8WWD3_9TELE|nr:hypothetical protein L3Q82_006925 [Scortum barcoo]